MPLTKEEQARYLGGSLRSPEWLALRCQILRRACDRCEKCKVPNHQHVVRFAGSPYDWLVIGDPRAGGRTADNLFAPDERVVRIVLTIHHVDGDPTNNDPANLQALCQCCHLNLNRAKHIRKRRANRRKLLATGDLFPDTLEA